MNAQLLRPAISADESRKICMLPGCLRVHAFTETAEETSVAEEPYRLVDLYCSQRAKDAYASTEPPESLLRDIHTDEGSGGFFCFLRASCCQPPRYVFRTASLAASSFPVPLRVISPVSIT